MKYKVCLKYYVHDCAIIRIYGCLSEVELDKIQSQSREE